MAVSDPGLCAGCAWARRIRSSRGSEFWKCGRSEVDETFPRYPRVPVTACTGYESVHDRTDGEDR